MTAWSKFELKKIGTAEELQIASLRRSGTYTKPVTIWVVQIDDDLYIRSVNGRTSGWFSAVLARHEGRIWAGGIEKDVSFVEVTDPDTNKKIDEAYLEKYRRYPQYVAPMVVDQSRAATLRLLPR